MFKRIISSMLIAVISVCAAAVQAAAQTAASGRIILSTGFKTEEAFSNNSMMYVDGKGEKAVRKVDGYMEISKITDNTDPYFDTELNGVSQNTVFSSDFAYSGEELIADLFRIRYSDNSMATFVTLDKGGIIRSGAKEIGKAPKNGKFFNVSVFYGTNGTYNIYLNGELKHTGNTGKEMNLQFVRCQLMPNGGNGKLMTDNFKIYEADSIAAVPQAYIINNTFDNADSYKAGFVRVSAGTGNSIIRKEDCYILIEKDNASSDPYIDVTVPDSDTYSSLVFSGDFGSDRLGAKVKLFWTRNTAGEYLTDINLKDNGDIYCGASIIGKITEGKNLVNIGVIYNVTDASYDVYIDGEQKISGAKTGKSGIIKNVRCQLLPEANSVGSLKIDNYRVYEGDAIEPFVDTDDIAEYSTMPGSETDITRLNGCIAYHTAANVAFYNGEKHTIEQRPYVRNGEIYISYESAAPIIGNTALSGDVLLEDLCNDCGKQLFYDKTGLIIVSDSDFAYKDDIAVINSLSTYMFSNRPSETAIKALYQNSEFSNIHPKLLANEADFNYFADMMNTDTRIGAWIRDSIRYADDVLQTAPCTYRLQEYRLNAVVRKMLDRIVKLSFAYKVTKKEEYASRALLEMESAASFPDWNPQHFLDTAEMTFAMAIGYDWCYDYISANGKTDLINNAIVNKGLREGEKQYRGYGIGTCFVYKDMNWNSVCNGSMAIGALAVMDKNTDFASYIIKNSIRSLEYILPSFAPDGDWNEGYAYWEYSISYIVRMMSCLKSALGTDFDIPKYTGIDNTAMFAISMQGSRGVNNFHDCGVSTDVSANLLWLGNYFNDPQITAYYIKSVDGHIQDDTVWRCLYYDRETTADVCDLPKDIKLDTTQSVSMRSSYFNKNASWLSFHAGKNDVNHTHYDEGTFVFDMLGERWAEDLGTDSLSYLGTPLDMLYRARTEGHNTLVINPCQEVGQSKNADCAVTMFQHNNSSSLAAVDLTDAYKKDADSVKRGFMMTDRRRTIIVRDEISLKAQSDIYWFMHTAAEVSIIDNNTAVLTIGSKKLQMKTIVQGGEAQLYSTSATPLSSSPEMSGQADNSKVNKVAIKVTGNADVSISVRFTPLEEQYAANAFSAEGIEDWSLSGDIGYEETDCATEYTISNEKFDDIIKNPSTINDVWSKKSDGAAISGMKQNSATTISREYGFGGKEQDNACIVFNTVGFCGSTRNDPFLNIESDAALKTDITAEFDVYHEGNYTLYVQLIDDSGKASSVMELSPSGNVSISGEAAKAECALWHRVSITADYSEATADVFIDSRKVAENIKCGDNLKRIKLIAFYPTDCPQSGYSGVMAVDNVRIYSGEKEKYYIEFCCDNIKTEEISAADCVYVTVGKEAVQRIYVAEYDGDMLKALNKIENGEEKNIQLGNNAVKIFVWDKYSYSPEKRGIEINRLF